VCYSTPPPTLKNARAKRRGRGRPQRPSPDRGSRAWTHVPRHGPMRRSLVTNITCAPRCGIPHTTATGRGLNRPLSGRACPAQRLTASMYRAFALSVIRGARSHPSLREGRGWRAIPPPVSQGLWALVSPGLSTPGLASRRARQRGRSTHQLLRELFMRGICTRCCYWRRARGTPWRSNPRCAS